MAGLVSGIRCINFGLDTTNFKRICNILIKHKLRDIYVLILVRDGLGIIFFVVYNETPFKICKHPVGSLDEIYSDWEALRRIWFHIRV